MAAYIAYYRVSTQKQGVTGLGLEAQQAVVANYLRGGELLAAYTEVESGKKDDRPYLLQALQHCKNTGATLVIAKLDRLSRNMTFISMLLDNKTKFVCCDMPDANEFTIHIFAAVAQWERKQISDRTKAALQALKDRGVKLGKNNLTDEARAKGVQAIKDNARERKENNQAAAMIQLLRENGVTLQAIADKLNKSKFKTSKGGKYTPTQVSRLLPK